MSACAAVMTGPGAGAIATIELFGESVRSVLESVFVPSGGGSLPAGAGRVVLGHIVDGAETVDQVTVGCEAPQRFALHCHGNPLIVERLMRLFGDRGVTLVTARQLRVRTLGADERAGAIAIEAKLAMTTVKTLEGARIIAHQAQVGLSAQAGRWQAQIGSISLDELRKQARGLLRDSDAARLIISGCCLALVGPPNTGKSTLLNALAGREKALVTDVRGTTRDWVSADIHIPPLAATVIDTAGLDADLTDGIDQAAQAGSVEVLRQADLVLLVLDRTQREVEISTELIDQLTDKRVLVVLNKSDLPARLDTTVLSDRSWQTVTVSAGQGTGLDNLINAIHVVCGVAQFDLDSPVAFTARQRRLLAQLSAVSSETEAKAIIWELLEGPLSV